MTNSKPNLLPFKNITQRLYSNGIFLAFILVSDRELYAQFFKTLAALEKETEFYDSQQTVLNNLGTTLFCLMS
jgi:hypothetical protein